MNFRIERDSMGEIEVPEDALYGAQTQRALNNFTIKGPAFCGTFLRALGIIKASAASANKSLGLLKPDIADAIGQAAMEVANGGCNAQFPIVIYQTGSGTSTNMNANEVIARRASMILKGATVHPNDHVNMGQSSNDVIPSAIHVSAYIECNEILLPGLRHLHGILLKRADDTRDIVKTGRTHMMDALPVTFGQEIGGWAHQIKQSIERVEATLPRLARLALGGTAVGTGVNAHPEFAKAAIAEISNRTGIDFKETENHFAEQAAMDTAVELSGQLKAAATALMKIANDLRLMNSGPLSGIGEISLPALQPGSSIMPGKVNPVICEATTMASAAVIGNDMSITVCNSYGNFELNVMLPLTAHRLLESIALIGHASVMLADKAIAGFSVNKDRINESLEKNPILVTALNPVIGYDKAAECAKRAYKEGRKIKDVAAEMTGMKPEELDKLLDPRKMTKGG